MSEYNLSAILVLDLMPATTKLKNHSIPALSGKPDCT